MNEDLIHSILEVIGRDIQNMGQAFVNVTHYEGEWKIHFTSTSIVFTDEQMKIHSIATLHQVAWKALWEGEIDDIVLTRYSRDVEGSD